MDTFFVLVKKSVNFFYCIFDFSQIINFGLKPINSLVFGYPDLKVGAMDSYEYKGFSPICCLVEYFMYRTHHSKSG